MEAGGKGEGVPGGGLDSYRLRCGGAPGEVTRSRAQADGLILDKRRTNGKRGGRKGGRCS